MHRFLVLSLVALFASACVSGDSSTRPPVAVSAAVTGTYTLRTVNSAPLPFVYQQVGADRYEVLDDAISLADAGTWTEIWHERWTEGGVASLKTFTDAGSYSRSGSTVTLVSPTTGTITVTVTAGALTLTTQGIVAVYQQ